MVRGDSLDYGDGHHMFRALIATPSVLGCDFGNDKWFRKISFASGKVRDDSRSSVPPPGSTVKI
jgi:hypothetical protein